MKKLPLFYFPPTICMVDDDPVFLEAIKNLLINKYNCLSFLSPASALDFLGEYLSPFLKINFCRELTESDVFDVGDSFPVTISISEIRKLSKISAIKDEIALLIIDNNMPLIDGISICHKLKEFTYKKLLLTGDTEPEEAIDAFNSGAINKFITKDKNLSEALQDNVHELVKQFFFDKTKNLLNYLESSRLSPLSDPIFIDFFYHWFESNNYREFYLMDKNGSFLVKKADGNTVYFIVMSESARDNFLSLNDDVTNEAAELLLELSKGNFLPFFGIERESWHFSYDVWHRHFYPASVIDGREKYYWTIIEGEV